MDTLLGRKVTILKMHELAHVPNAGQFETTIDITKTKEQFGKIVITKVEDGFLINSSKGWDLFIPNGNTISALFLQEKK